MTGAFQEVAVYVILLGTTAFLGIRWWRNRRAKGCSGCSAAIGPQAKTGVGNRRLPVIQ